MLKTKRRRKPIKETKQKIEIFSLSLFSFCFCSSSVLLQPRRNIKHLRYISNAKKREKYMYLYIHINVRRELEQKKEKRNWKKNHNFISSKCIIYIYVINTFLILFLSLSLFRFVSFFFSLTIYYELSTKASWAKESEREEEKCMLKNYYNFYFCRGSFYAIAIIVATLCYNIIHVILKSRERKRERKREDKGNNNNNWNEISKLLNYIILH